jgi:uncharacterized protein with HEPN domain
MPREADPARDPAYLLDMLTAAEAVSSFVAGRTREQYAQELMLRSAVERQVEIIGEAARHVSAEFRGARPGIAWAPIQAQRHRLAHEYGEIDDDLIWKVATVHVPELIRQLRPLIPPTDG